MYLYTKDLTKSANALDFKRKFFNAKRLAIIVVKYNNWKKVISNSTRPH